MNFFKQMKDSVVDFKFYTQIRNNSFGKSFLYLLLLFLVIYSLGATRDFVYLKSGIDQATYYVNENLPDFRLQNGEFSFDGPMPHYFANVPDNVFVIDTTGQVTESTLDKASNGILVTKNFIYVRKPSESRKLFFKDIPGFNFTKTEFVNFIPKINWIILGIMVIGFIFVFAYKLLNALLLALLGLMIASSLKAELKYQQLLNFSIYALTFPLLLQLAVKLSGYAIPFFGLIYWLISFTYMAMAIKTWKDTTRVDHLRIDDTDGPIA